MKPGRPKAAQLHPSLPRLSSQPRGLPLPTAPSARWAPLPLRLPLPCARASATSLRSSAALSFLPPRGSHAPSPRPRFSPSPLVSPHCRVTIRGPSAPFSLLLFPISFPLRKLPPLPLPLQLPPRRSVGQGGHFTACPSSPYASPLRESDSGAPEVARCHFSSPSAAATLSTAAATPANTPSITRRRSTSTPPRTYADPRRSLPATPASRRRSPSSSRCRRSPPAHSEAPRTRPVPPPVSPWRKQCVLKVTRSSPAAPRRRRHRPYRPRVFLCFSPLHAQLNCVPSPLSIR